jgi:HlyD family secretion protein
MTTIQKSNSKKISTSKIIILVVLILLIAGGGYFYFRMTSQARQASTANANPVQTAKATVGSLVLFASGTGTIQPEGNSNISFNTSGQVSKIDVKIGDHVTAGQVLAELDDTTAQINVAQAQGAMNKLTSAAAIATAEQTLADAQTNLAAVTPTLEHLISPEVLYWEENVTLREQALADAKAANQTDTSNAANQKVTDVQASLKFAQDSLAYFQKEYTHTYVPTYFTQFQTVRGRTEPVQVLDTVTGKMIDEVYPPTEGEIGTARAAYDLAKASIAEDQTYLDVLNGGEIPDGATGANLVTYIQTKHALETAQYNLNATKLIAPISGTVSAINITVGGLSAQGTSAITISNLDQPYGLDGFIDAKDWGEIQPGYNVNVTFDTIPGQVFKGTVTSVYPTLDTSSSNSALIHFTARLNAPISYNLPSGAAASIEIIGGTATNAVLVPIEALHEFDDGKYALFVMQNGKLQLRVVEVGLKDLTKAEIKSGLKSGDIVTTGVIKTK